MTEIQESSRDLRFISMDRLLLDQIHNRISSIRIIWNVIIFSLYYCFNKNFENDQRPENFLIFLDISRKKLEEFAFEFF